MMGLAVSLFLDALETLYISIISTIHLVLL